METIVNTQYVVNSLVFSGLGIAILVLCWVALDLATPKTHIWTELCQGKNVALAIVLGAFMLSVALIISSAIHG